MAAWLQERWAAPTQRNGVLLSFRNAGKSTLVGLFCAWMLTQNSGTRILVVAAEHALARKMVRNVKRILERHPGTAYLLPSSRDQWAADALTVEREAEWRDPSVLARGLGANVTGARADVIICDDVEVPNTCTTPMRRADLRARLHELDYVIVPGGMQVYLGTPHTADSIYAVTPNTPTNTPYVGEAYRGPRPKRHPSWTVSPVWRCLWSTRTDTPHGRNTFRRMPLMPCAPAPAPTNSPAKCNCCRSMSPRDALPPPPLGSMTARSKYARPTAKPCC